MNRLEFNGGRPPASVESSVLWIISLSALLFAAGCKANDPSRYIPGLPDAVRGVSIADVRTAISARVDSGRAPSWVPPSEWKRVKALYRRFGNSPLWLEADGVKDRANALLHAIEQAPTHALATKAYPIDSIRRVIDADDVMKNASARSLADADVLLTAAFGAYASDMLIGQVDPKTVSQAWHIPSRPTEVDSALVRTLQSPSMEQGLAAMAPQDSAYAVLKDAYARYQRIAGAGGWPVVPASGVQRATALRQRLLLEGFLNDSTAVGGAVQTGARTGGSSPSDTNRATLVGKSTPVPQDARVVDALKRFQEQHGFEPTGKLTAGTLEALNIAAAVRVEQIASNLERHRWLPRSLGSRYIYVNVPSFRLEAYDNSQKALEMKVVVGAEYQGRATPVFSDSMEVVVFRPFWNIPDNIAEKEIWPKAASDPEYLARGNYETYNERGTQRVRQRPGDKNALGLVKFLFPNDFSIYLHDTPQKSLFAKPDRAASHGCIRVEKPTELAQFVLGWPADRVEAAMHGSNDNTVKVPRKIPVYIVYFTAYARDGQLFFGDDLYERDESLEEAVADTIAPRSTGSVPKP